MQKPKRPDLQAVLEHYGVYVSHSGMAKCVFHSEDDPSMSVSLEKQLVRCHACGVGGDAWTIIMRRENLNWNDSIDFAARHRFKPEETEGGGGAVRDADISGAGRLARRSRPGRR
ncbi:hypothetical protein EMG21_30190, partial [Klebsiella pneumoniae]